MTDYFIDASLPVDGDGSALSPYNTMVAHLSTGNTYWVRRTGDSFPLAYENIPSDTSVFGWPKVEDSLYSHKPDMPAWDADTEDYWRLDLSTGITLNTIDNIRLSRANITPSTDMDIFTISSCNNILLDNIKLTYNSIYNGSLITTSGDLIGLVFNNLIVELLNYSSGVIFDLNGVSSSTVVADLIMNNTSASDTVIIDSSLNTNTTTTLMFNLVKEPGNTFGFSDHDIIDQFKMNDDSILSIVSTLEAGSGLGRIMLGDDFSGTFYFKGPQCPAIIASNADCDVNIETDELVTYDASPLLSASKGATIRVHSPALTITPSTNDLASIADNSNIWIDKLSISPVGKVSYQSDTVGSLSYLDAGSIYHTQTAHSTVVSEAASVSNTYSFLVESTATTATSSASTPIGTSARNIWSYKLSPGTYTVKLKGAIIKNGDSALRPGDVILHMYIPDAAGYIRVVASDLKYTNDVWSGITNYSSYEIAKEIEIVYPCIVTARVVTNYVNKTNLLNYIDGSLSIEAV